MRIITLLVMVSGLLLASCSEEDPRPHPPPPPTPRGWMDPLLWVVVLVGFLLFPLPVYAEGQDLSTCSSTIERIVQHEVGNTHNETMIRFVAEQVIHDLTRMPCRNLTRRWAIDRHGYYSYHHVTALVRRTVADTLATPSRYPVCQFVGNPSDVKVWQLALPVTVDVVLTQPPFTVVGVNCHE